MKRIFKGVEGQLVPGWVTDLFCLKYKGKSIKELKITFEFEVPK